MNFDFHNKRISGILTILPKNEVKFEDEIGNYNFSRNQSMKLKLVMGYDKHRLIEDNVCASDLCIFGLEYLFNKRILDKDEIDALVLVTQSPDYFMPPTSNIIQGRLGLKEDILCMDINQGCAGFIIGLYQAFLLLEQKNIYKVVLLNADILSRKVSKRDRNSNPLIGDGAAVTIIEKTDTPVHISGSIKMRGKDAMALMIPAGGFHTPSSAETAQMTQDESGNFRSLDNLVMQGDSVFNFVQTDVPPLIHELLSRNNKSIGDVDYFLFHQPNRFMLTKLADAIGVPHEKMPNNIVEHFGNSSGVTIPVNICFNLGEKVLSNSYRCCLSGFGVGLTWASLLLDLGNLTFCNIIDYK